MGDISSRVLLLTLWPPSGLSAVNHRCTLSAQVVIWSQTEVTVVAEPEVMA